MYKIFIVAGEASGDKIGARLMQALNASREQFDFYGIGGSEMSDAGLKTLFPSADIAIIGFFEVLLSALKLKSLLGAAIRAAVEYKPDMIITLDSSGFNFRLIDTLRKHFRKLIELKRKLGGVIGIKQPVMLHYVAPMLWAYKPSRALRVSNLYDHILLTLPFETQYFRHMPHTYVGHLILEQQRSISHSKDIKELFGRERKTILITVMPGSRLTELRYHLPLLAQVMKRISEYLALRGEEVHYIVPTLPSLEEYISTYFDKKGLGCLVSVVINEEDKLCMIQQSAVALVKSGTSVLDMCIYKVPTVAFYKISNLTFWLLKYVLNFKCKYVTLPNIIMNMEIVPEFIQSQCNVSTLCAAVINFLEHPDKASKQLSYFKKVMELLKESMNIEPKVETRHHTMQYPSERAAEVVLTLLKNSPN